MSFGSKPPKVVAAPPAPLRSNAETSNLAAEQRRKLRGQTGIRATSFTGGLGAATSANSVTARLLSGVI